MKIKVLFALGNRLLSLALRDLLVKSKCKHIIEIQLPSAENFHTSLNNYDVIMTDYLSMSRIPKESFKESKIVVIDNGLEKETITSLFITENISGFIDADSDVNMLIKAIEVVHNGEVWINNITIKSLLGNTISKSIKDTIKLTEREYAIIRIVKEGYRNKEIASMLSISEQTVKSHLNRIFRKMKVSGRTELISRISNQSKI